jgi:hypothetical protein
VVGGSNVRDGSAVVMVGVALAMFDDIAAVVASQSLGVSFAAGIGGPLDYEEAAFSRFDVLQQDEQQVLGGVVSLLSDLGYRPKDRWRRHVVILPASDPRRLGREPDQRRAS